MVVSCNELELFLHGVLTKLQGEEVHSIMEVIISTNT